MGTFVLLAGPSESYVVPFVRQFHRPVNRRRRFRPICMPSVGGPVLKEGFQVRPADSSATADQRAWQFAGLDVLLHGWPGDVQNPSVVMAKLAEGCRSSLSVNGLQLATSALSGRHAGDQSLLVTYPVRAQNVGPGSEMDGVADPERAVALALS